MGFVLKNLGKLISLPTATETSASLTGEIPLYSALRSHFIIQSNTNTGPHVEEDIIVRTPAGDREMCDRLSQTFTSYQSKYEFL